MFTTPRGLKVRLEENFSRGVFNDDNKFYQALKYTEYYIGLPDLFCLIGFLIAYFIGLDKNKMFVLIAGTILVGNALKYSFNFFKLWNITRLINISAVFAVIENWFLDKIAMAVIIIIAWGWKYLLYYIIAIWGTKLVFMFLLTLVMGIKKHIHGIAFTDSEQIFINSSCFILHSHPQVWLHEYKKYLSPEEE